MINGRSGIGPGDLLRVIGRAFLIQASWSFERMQSLGFAYAIEPVLRKLYPDQKEFSDRLKLHMHYFNTQPYLASFILGAVVRMEQDRAEQRAVIADVQGLKTALMAPLGALGDSFFWGALKPMAAVIAVAMVVGGAWWAPFFFLIVYNVWHIGLRVSLVFMGYRSGGDAVALMSHYHFTAWARQFKLISLAVLGGVVGAMPVWRTELKPGFQLPGMLLAVSGMAFTLLLVAVLRRGGSPLKLMLALAVLCLILALAGVV